ncbi:hypothetical protein SLS58_010392 [Diplodia intermedia]|uniref:Uncharacterized protein n=1 Tax=Diplodia intermedia TaxID=856260 RepID=A0ABR3T6D6_9PEZI
MSPSSHSAERVAEKVQTLSDLELAALLCLITKEHAIVEAEPSLLDPLCLELELVLPLRETIAGSVFGLSSTVLECSEKTTLDTFGNGLLVEDDDISYFSSPPRNSRDTNNQFFISHYHQDEDGFPNLDEYRGLDDDQASLSSVVRPSSSMTLGSPKAIAKSPLFPQDDLDCITKLLGDVRISSEVFAYMQNLIAFLRLHRAVSGGISALATRHFELLVRMQWGSSLEAVREVLDGVTVDDVIEDVLQQVEVPL